MRHISTVDAGQSAPNVTEALVEFIPRIQDRWDDLVDSCSEPKSDDAGFEPGATATSL